MNVMNVAMNNRSIDGDDDDNEDQVEIMTNGRMVRIILLRPLSLLSRSN